MTNKPISNAEIKRNWKAKKRYFGFSRNEVLNLNTELNKLLRFTKNPEKFNIILA